MEDQNIYSMEFGSKEIPIPYESRNSSDTTYVQWGLGNSYPQWLLSLYNDSAIHSSIVNQKVIYVLGDGLKDKNNNDMDSIKVNPNDSLLEFVGKITKDYLLFNSFAIEVIFNSFNQPIQFYHVPIHKIRMNKTRSRFWFNDDWIQSRKTIEYERYSVKNNKDTKSKIFYYDGFFPSLNNIYPTPEYIGSVKAIVTDISIKEFNLNNINNSFSPSTLITFFNGNNVPDKVKKTIVDDIENKFTGTNGKKYIVDFQTKDGKGAEIKNITVGDWDKAYDLVVNRTIDDILIGHQTVSPVLFGVKTAGQLGNVQELEISYQIFKNNYVSVKRREIETALNELFTNFSDINSQIIFSDKPLYNETIPDTTKEKIYTINELRKIAGLPSIPNGDRLLVDSTSSNNTNNVTPVQNEDVKKNSKILTADDFELVKHLGVNMDEYDFEELTIEDEYKFGIIEDISNYLVNNEIKDLTIDQIVKKLKDDNINTTPDQVKSVIDKLVSSGVIGVGGNGNKITITPNNNGNLPTERPVSVYYKYQKRSDVNGPELIPTSRGFCVKLIESNKLYSRSDIQQMSSIFGYDIFRYRGGFYHDPEKNLTTPYCRHEWIPLKVSKKP